MNRSTGEAFGPGDVVRAYPMFGFLPARRVVERLAKIAHLDADGQALVARFAGLAPPAA